VERILTGASRGLVAGVADRRAAVWHAVNEITDPCSAAMAEPIGIADLGLVDQIRIEEGQVEVTLLPTSPHCLFLGLFEEEIEARVRELDWVRSVDVRLFEGETIWDESRLTPSARTRLARRREAAAATLSQRGRREGR
jgi:metal-sulfur cluster biosynthetic enzyme